MRIACVSYRDWALSIYDQLARESDHTYLIVRSKAQFDESAILDFKPDLMFFYGWSWMIDNTLLQASPCIMLHPSPLPKYRGGSPIQNQIISGETQSAVTLFVMTEEMDAGDIVGQMEISLNGNLEEIFRRITDVGLVLTRQILKEGLKPIPQDHNQATYCKRRKPSDSEIQLEELASASGRFLYNKIRMLADPYPNAYIRTRDGCRLLIKEADLISEHH